MNNETLKYSPKHEKIILGTMISDTKSREELSVRLSEKDFHVTKHKLIFSGLCTIVNKKLAYTPITLSSIMPDEEWGDITYLELLEKLSNPSNIEHHIKHLKWDITRLNSFKNTLPTLASQLKNPKSTPESVLSICNKIKDDVESIETRNYHVSGKDALNRYKAALLAREVKSSTRSVGYKILDKKMNRGYADGLVTVITAASSIGKTTFAVNTTMKLSKVFKICYVCWESGRDEIIDIMVSSKTKIPLEKIVKYTSLLTDKEKKKINEATEKILGNDNIIFLGQPPKDISDGAPWDVNIKVIDWLIYQIMKLKPHITFVDLLSKRLPDDSPTAEKRALNKIQEAVHPENLNTHIVILHQTTMKEQEKYGVKDFRPTRAILKGSSAWFDVPDNVFGLYRPAVYTRGIKDDKFEVICLKQRGGEAQWKAIMKWEGEICKISGGRLTSIAPKEERRGFGHSI